VTAPALSTQQFLYPMELAVCVFFGHFRGCQDCPTIKRLAQLQCMLSS